ncbi:hypothetical protein [Paenibacillus glycanilyticus]|uniref:PhoD-like phosphatase metallophosphatase domain-containing protein n=1 Tax=Paenibacillus glycanilyticus TaxID=126569 RepID=A0ABQ6GA86_9BACL|nr:hypothetical protein [Paenibacillus glycanilyticus]GLX67869.1 hypothetical protein MU1_22140 [Paenibacillus glycanilyticus]
MDTKDIFVGPLLRRAQEDLVVICLAVFKPVNLIFSVREHGKNHWLGHDNMPIAIQVSQTLYVYFGRVTPSESGKKFPVRTLLEYGIGVLGPNEAEKADYESFEAIVATDGLGLAYDGHKLPTFFLQSPSQKLNVLYGSCRKIHDEHGGKLDALPNGDKLIAEHVNDLDNRPAVLCLGGDQIYADDVDPTVLEEVMALAKRIEGSDPEKLPIASSLPGIGRRKDFVTKYAKFTSGDSVNHLVTFAEYLAMYGLMWNKNNWKVPLGAMSSFTSSLGNVRRLLANIPTYMIFDDHDITDDWNLCVRWQKEVGKAPLGKRIIANGLMAFWLMQGFGNQPDLYTDKKVYDIADRISNRNKNYEQAEELFWGLRDWEFFTPTYPFIYFLDTRTQRGVKDGLHGSDEGAPAYLKNHLSWSATNEMLNVLLKRQNRDWPLVLVAAAPVFGFNLIEESQNAISAVAGPYFLDLESWSANRQHFLLFLNLMADRDVVILSGDVHYAFTSTMKSVVYDDQSLRNMIKLLAPGTTFPKVPRGSSPTYEPLLSARFLQLTSSALKNYAKGKITQSTANLSGLGSALILTEDGSVLAGIPENGGFTMIEWDLAEARKVVVRRTKEEVKPARLFRQRVNDAANSRYVGEHNIGVASFQGRTVTNYFYTVNGKESEYTWNFANGSTWD